MSDPHKMLSESRIQWKWGALAALAMTVVALYPQINLWVVRGDEWRGSFVLTQGDEVAYASYINALIDGRPRKNDPFTGRDDLPDKPASESFFSIQFVPAYLIALPARMLGLPTSTVFIWLIVIGATTSSLAIFWLLAALSGNSKLAAAGALFTLSFGTFVGLDCCWRANAFTGMLPFLRRYQPSFAFPLFFVFCILVWQSLSRESKRARLFYSLAAGALFSMLVFSYFFIWTAALAWFGCVVILWILFRRGESGLIATTSIVIGAFTVVTLMPFFALLSRRHSSTDQSQLMEFTHAPNLFNQSEIIGFIALGVIGYASWRKMIDISSPEVLYTVSFALMPFVIFNQQILTGRSLQPIHYQVFIANYVVLISIVLLFLVLWRARNSTRPIPSGVLVLTTIAALGFAMFEVSKIAKLEALKAMLRDDIAAVAHRLTTMAIEDGSVPAALDGNGPFPTVFTPTLDVAMEVFMAIPSDSPVAVLWSLHNVGINVSFAESKERFYRHLYYSGLTPKMVGARMRENEFWVVVPLFGSKRVVQGLVKDFKPIVIDEIEEERGRYADFYNNFTREQAANPTLNFVVVPNGPGLPNFDNLDRWYERDSGQKVGAFRIYRIKLRP